MADSKLMKLLLSYAKPYWKSFLFVLIIMFFSILYIVSNNFLLSIIVGFVINIILFMFIKALLVKEERNVEGLLFGISTALSIVYFAILIIAYLLGNYTYQYNQYC